MKQPTISDMTDYELNFSIKIEEMLSKVNEPVFRQIIVEVIFKVILYINDIKIYNFSYLILNK